MIFADTGFFVALARPRDELHERALRWVAALREPILLSDYVIWELFNALSNPIERPKSHLLFEHITTSPGYEIVAASAEWTEQGIALHAERPDKAWSLTDCISFSIMEERGLHQALAHDHHFEQAGFDALLRRDPP